MGPKADISKLVAEFNDKVADWDIVFESFTETGKAEKKVPKSVKSTLDKSHSEVVDAFKAIRKTDPNYKTSYPDVEAMNKKVSKEHMTALFRTKTDSEESGNDSETDTKESADDIMLKDLISKLDAVNEIIDAAEARLQTQYNTAPDPTNVSVSLASKAYESIKDAEKNINNVYVDLKVLLTRLAGYETQRAATKAKYLEITSGVADKLATAEEYIAKYQYPHAQSTGLEDKSSAASQNAGASSSQQTPTQLKNTLERLPLPTFDGKKMNYLRFKKEFSNHVTYASDKERMLALKTKCLLKNIDKDCVMYEQTLKECWESLDKVYGEIWQKYSKIGKV